VANPRLRGRSAGGSSGGSAAAVAAGSVAFALGTDGGGSIRIPASFCGVVGLKSSRGLLPRGGSIPGGATLTEPGPLCRSVADARTVLRVLVGGDEVAEVHRPALRLLEGSVSSCTSAVREVLSGALEEIAPDGTTLLDLDGAAESWYSIFAAEASSALRGELRRMSPDLQRLVEEGAAVASSDYAAARAFADDLTHRLDDALTGCDALLLPTVPSTAPTDEPAWDDDDFFGDMRFTVPANLTGHPAVTVPVPGVSEPAGLQLIGKRGRDDLLLAAAGEVERRLNGNAEGNGAGY
jgi:Asp-tRNA(Asn)/Glu-tRNA(Gln) amidotransferase A subunit family amidase